jgi:hypothetical protein
LYSIALGVDVEAGANETGWWKAMSAHSVAMTIAMTVGT